MPTRAHGYLTLLGSLLIVGVVCLCSGLAIRAGINLLAEMQSPSPVAPSPATQETAATSVPDATRTVSPAPTEPLPTRTNSPAPSPSATALPATAPPQVTTYVVQPGDTLTIIAQRFNVTLEALVQANDIKDPDRVEVGQALIIPPH